MSSQQVDHSQGQRAKLSKEHTQNEIKHTIPLSKTVNICKIGVAFMEKSRLTQNPQIITIYAQWEAAGNVILGRDAYLIKGYHVVNCKFVCSNIIIIIIIIIVYRAFPCHAQVGRFPPIKLFQFVLSNVHSLVQETKS